MIDERTVWMTGGLQFDSLEKAERYRADRLGEVMDNAPLLLSPGERIKLNDYMVENRAALRKLLDW